MSDPATISCPRCRGVLSVATFVEKIDVACPHCTAPLGLSIFPRLFRAPVEGDASQPAAAGEAGCTFFPQLRADHICDECGCFLSNWAAVQWGGTPLCMPCLYRLREERQDPAYVAQVRRYDNLALTLVTWLAPVSFITAPVAIFLLLRHRKAPRGFVPQRGVRWWVAMVVASLFLLGWLTLLVIWLSLVVEEMS